jgi:hypothetical protein
MNAGASCAPTAPARALGVAASACPRHIGYPLEAAAEAGLFASALAVPALGTGAGVSSGAGAPVAVGGCAALAAGPF